MTPEQEGARCPEPTCQSTDRFVVKGDCASDQFDPHPWHANRHPAPSPHEGAAREWTLEVCPECGATEEMEPEGCDYCEVSGGHLEKVTVREVRETAPTEGEAARCDGADLIATERQRQVEAEGWRPEHDDEYRDGTLVRAAVTYLDRDPDGEMEHDGEFYFDKTRDGALASVPVTFNERRLRFDTRTPSLQVPA